MIEPLARQPRAGQHRVGHVRERERVAVHEQQLLLQPDGERLPGAEAVHGGTAGLARLLGAAHGVSPRAARAAMRPNTSAAASPLA